MPFLTPTDHSDESDYINAVFLPVSLFSTIRCVALN